jgi:hypothetical protein
VVINDLWMEAMDRYHLGSSSKKDLLPSCAGYCEWQVAFSCHLLQDWTRLQRAVVTPSLMAFIWWLNMLGGKRLHLFSFFQPNFDQAAWQVNPAFALVLLTVPVTVIIWSLEIWISGHSVEHNIGHYLHDTVLIRLNTIATWRCGRLMCPASVR